MGAVREDMASKDILSQAYAGADVSKMDPTQQQNVLQQASVLAGQKGLNSLSYSFQKQSTELNKNVTAQKLQDIKYQQQTLEYAGQILPTAANEEELTNAFSGVKDPAAQMQIQAVIKNPNLNIEQKKKLLGNMTQTVENHLKAVQLEASLSEREDRIDTRDLRLELNRIESKSKNGLPLTAEEKITRETGVLPKYQKAKEGAPTVTPAGAGADGGNFLESRAAIESGGYKGDAAYSAKSDTSSAVGKYGITKNTYDRIREEDPSLPEFSKLRGNKDAQEKAAKIHEAQITKEITNAGLQPTNANKDLWWRFGDPDAKKLVKADPNTPVADVLSKKVIDANPDLQGKVTVGEAIQKNLSGAGKTGQISYETEKANKRAEVAQMYEDVSIPIQKQIGDIAQVGKEFSIPPNKLVGQGAKAKTAILGDYDVLQQTEKVSNLIAKNPSAVGTIASLVQSSGGLTKNLLDNVAANKDNKYTEEVAILAKELATLGLQDAAASGGGRINQYLEKMFVGIYDRSLSPQSLVGVLKDRQDDAVRNLNRRIGADKENLNKEEYPLLFSKSSKQYMDTESSKTKEQDKKYGVDSTKERPPISSFGGGKGGSFKFGQGDLSF